VSVIKNIFELAKEIKDSEFFRNDTTKLRFSRNSIAKQSDDAILHFPVLTSSALSLDDLTMINKALEREYTTFIRVALGLSDVTILNVNGDESVLDVKRKYIKKFHQNLGNVTSPSINIESANLECLKPYKEDLRMKSLNESTVKKVISEADADEGSILTALNNRDHNKSSKFTNQLLDNDVKKANELIPTTIDVPLTIVTTAGESINTNILVGIKAVSHLIPSDEMVYNISTAVETKRGLFRFIQWTTGEISFFKDYLLMMDAAKKQATAQRSTNSAIWRRLKSRSLGDKIKRTFIAKNQLLPNATILITMDEAEYIKNNYNIDLLNDVKSVKNLMDVYFLLGFVICDSASEIAYFIFDNQTTFQPVSFKALEKESSSSSRELKSIVSILNKGR